MRNIGGLETVNQELKETAEYQLKFPKPELFARFKRDPSRGVLFYGSPGCGKTLLAKSGSNRMYSKLFVYKMFQTFSIKLDMHHHASFSLMNLI